MRRPGRARLTTATTQAVAWFVLLVLGLGWPRFLVSCTGPHCDSRLEFVHAASHCCDHDHGGGASGHGQEVSLSPGCGGCVDVAIGFETGPLPRKLAVDQDCPAVTWTTTLPSFHAPDELQAVALRPPTTGPPRPDRRTELIESTILLL
jgi:hypothetical protein